MWGVVTIGMSTSCSHSYPLEQTFRLSADIGFDGVEVMVMHDRRTRDADTLRALATRYQQPILSIHAPVLLATSFVFGLSAKTKLEKSAELARAVGAPTVVVHPPFRWQGGYSKVFAEVVGEVSARYGVRVAVENMFGWKAGHAHLDAYAPTWNPGTLPVDSLTLDFSHAALNGSSGLELATQWSDRLQHVHLCDGTFPDDNPHLFDEHLAPGDGSQPVSSVLEHLAAERFDGAVIAEVSTASDRTREKKMQRLGRTLEYARRYSIAPVTALPVPRDQIVLARAS